MENQNENLGEGTSNVEGAQVAGNGESNQTETSRDESNNTSSETKPEEADQSGELKGHFDANGGGTGELSDSGEAKSTPAASSDKINDEDLDDLADEPKALADYSDQAAYPASNV